MKTIKLKNSLPNVFDFIVYPFGPTMDELNEAYISHSGEKMIAPLVERSISSVKLTEFKDVFGDPSWDYVGTIPEVKAQQIGAIITAKFSDKWQKLHDALNLVYDPIENYNSIEEEITKEKNTGTVKDAHNKTIKQTGTVKDENNRTIKQTGTVTDAGTDDGTVTNEHDLTHGMATKTKSDATAETLNNVFGFNTTDPAGVPSDKSNGSNNITQDVVNSGTDKETNKETRALTNGNTRTDDLTNAETGGSTRTDDLTNQEEGGNTRTDDLQHDSNRTLTRHGNIGVTTSQQMLQSEIELRQWNFYDQVFRDLDSVLVCPVY